MKSPLMICCGLLLVSLSCTGTNVTMGPYTTSLLGAANLGVGVAGWGLAPVNALQEGEFALILVNTDSNASHTVEVTTGGAAQNPLTIAACSIEVVVGVCDTTPTTIGLTGTTTTIDVTPDTTTCGPETVYIVTADSTASFSTDPPTTTSCQGLDEAIALVLAQYAQ